MMVLIWLQPHIAYPWIIFIVTQILQVFAIIQAIQHGAIF